MVDKPEAMRLLRNILIARGCSVLIIEPNNFRPSILGNMRLWFAKTLQRDVTSFLSMWCSVFGLR
jgi:hypothetical protein